MFSEKMYPFTEEMDAFAKRNVSIFLEMYDAEYDSKIFDNYRNFVIEKNKTLGIDESNSNLTIGFE